ncbi:MAG TPA: hypothetical protein VMU83_02910 [Hanamia sp.]|nr:hypothetical protein [Hanamia sp.]
MQKFVGPYEPIRRYKVAIINDGGLPVELKKTDLTIEELWFKSKQQKDLNMPQSAATKSGDELKEVY